MTNKYVKLTLNFANNMALIVRDYPPKPTQNDFLIQLFNEVLAEYPKYHEYLPVVSKLLLKGKY